MRRAALVLGAALVLAGCGDADVETPTSGPDQVPESPADTPQAVAPGVDPSPSPSGTIGPGECQALPTDDDGDYVVADAGSAVVRLEGDRLVIDEVTPAEGWEHSVETEEDAEVEIRFTRDERHVDLEVEIDDDGLPTVEVCADDA